MASQKAAVVIGPLKQLGHDSSTLNSLTLTMHGHGVADRRGQRASIKLVTPRDTATAIPPLIVNTEGLCSRPFNHLVLPLITPDKEIGHCRELLQRLLPQTTDIV